MTDLSANPRAIDPLLECLVIFTKLHGRPYSAAALTEGLPAEPGRTTPELFSTRNSKALFSRAAARGGFASRLVKRVMVQEISPLVLPCILVLKGKNACILEEFDAQKKHAKIILPELGEVENWITLEDLNAEYLGYAFYLKKEFRYHERSPYLVDHERKHWFWDTLKKSTGSYRDIILASFFINLFVLATPLFTMNVYDRVVPNNAVETLWVLSLGVVVIYLFDMILKFIRSYFIELAGKRSDIIMSSILFEKVMDLQMAAMPKSIGAFANNLREFESIRGFFTSSTIAALIDFPFAILFLLVTYSIAGAIVLVPLITIVLITIYLALIKKPLQRSIESTYKAGAEKNRVLIESLLALETLKILGAVGHAQWRWEESTGDIAKKGIQSKLLSSSIPVVTGLLTQMNTVAVVFAGVYMIREMELTMGGLIATMILSSRAIAPMGQFAALISSFEQTKTAFKTLDSIMQLPVEHPEGKKFVQRPEFNGKIEFKNVSFSYPDSAKGALERVSFTIKPGEHVGIVGRIGSGKSSTLKLLMGLYPPTQGAILIDGIDILQIDPADLRQSVGYVPQDVMLFDGTVKENIIYKAPHVDDETMLAAAKISGTLEMVNRHPLGFDMPAGERGASLSGGQRQGIAIARAFLLDPPIMLLDEPSSSMDSVSENRLIGELKKEMEGKTMLLVTHKSVMLALVDRLIVIEEGKVIMDDVKEKVLDELRKKK